MCLTYSCATLLHRNNCCQIEEPEGCHKEETHSTNYLGATRLNASSQIVESG